MDPATHTLTLATSMAGVTKTQGIRVNNVDTNFSVCVQPGCRSLMFWCEMPRALVRVNCAVRISIRNSVGDWSYSTRFIPLELTPGFADEVGDLFPRVKNLRNLIRDPSPDGLLIIRVELKNLSADFDQERVDALAAALAAGPAPAALAADFAGAAAAASAPATFDVGVQAGATDNSTAELFQIIAACVCAATRADLREMRAAVRALSVSIDAREDLLGSIDAREGGALECPVCMTETKDTRMECGHTFCATCAARATRCPICRAVCRPDAAQRVYL